MLEIPKYSAQQLSKVAAILLGGGGVPKIALCPPRNPLSVVFPQFYSGFEPFTHKTPSFGVSSSQPDQTWVCDVCDYRLAAQVVSLYFFFATAAACDCSFILQQQDL